MAKASGSESKVKSSGDKKKKVSGYILFSTDRRAHYTKTDPELKGKELMKILGADWSKCSDEEKAKWNAKA